MGTEIRELFPSLTQVTCDCCEETFVDEVGLMLVSDAVLAYRDELVARAERERDAYAEAHRVSAEAIAAAKAGRGA